MVTWDSDYATTKQVLLPKKNFHCILEIWNQ